MKQLFNIDLKNIEFFRKRFIKEKNLELFLKTGLTK